MKKIITLLLLVATSAINLGADTKSESNYSIVTDFPFVSEYVSRGIGVTEASIQPSIEFTSGGFYISVWSNQPLTSDSVSNEFDFFVGHNWSLNDTMTLDIGAIGYYFPEASENTSTVEPYVGLNTALMFGLSGSAYVYHDVTIDVSTVQFDLSYSIETTDSLLLDIAANYGGVNVLNTVGDYTYYGFSASFNYVLNDAVVPYCGVAYSIRDINSVSEEFVYFTVGVTVGLIN
tara:strand:+ start:8254 stop:8952 length:699 start_codon:yes stop_codon:yes gene_type:complete